MPEKGFRYSGKRFPDPEIHPVCYEPGFFTLELDLESDLFCELRRKNGIRPARLNRSSPEELDRIRGFFLENRDTFYFLFHQSGELIGSISFIENYMQSLCISRKYQRQGYGEKLAKYCVNRILDNGYANVELHVLEGNTEAEKLYTKLGFVECDPHANSPLEG